MKTKFFILFLLLLIAFAAKAQVNLQSGLVAYYPFNGNAKDESGNGNNGTVNGATLTTDRFGNVGKAYNFDGISNYIEIPNSNTINFSNYMTISLWLNSSQLNKSMRIIDKTTVSSADGYLLDSGSGSNSNENDKIRFVGANGGYVTSNSVDEFKWYHLTLSFENGLIKFYINGVLDKSISATSNTLSSTNWPLFIGKSTNQSSCNCQLFNGIIDDIRLYSRALSSDEITQLYDSEKPATDLSTGLVAYYPFNGNANDESGNGNNGTVNGPTVTTDRFGNSGKAYSFDGSSNSITSNTNFFNNGWEQFTVSGWFSTNDVNKLSQTILNTIPHTGIDLCFNIEYTAQHNTSIYIGSSPGVLGWDIVQNSQGSKKDYENQKWYHFSMIKNGLKYYLYINNILDMIITSSITPSNTLCKITFGSNNIRPEYFYGNIDDIRIYNRALSSDEVTQIYNSEKPATDLTTGLVAYYPFNGNANDASGNGNNGTVNGATLTTDRFGNVGKAYSFDGVRNYIEVSNRFFNNGWGNYTISGWFNCANVSGSSQDLLSTNPICGTILGLNKGFAPNKLSFSINSNPDNQSWDIVSINANTTIVQNNQWYHFNLVKTGNNYKYYVNGNLEIENSGAITPISYLCGMLIGIQYWGPEGYNNGFNGKLDDYRIYNRALSSDEIAQLYNSEKPATDLTTGLVAYYPFNGNANDESGNGNNGTVNGATLTKDRFGNVGKAYGFNGGNVKIENNNFPIGNNPRSVSAWVRANLGTSSSGAGRDIILYGSSQNNAAILRFWNKNTCAIGVEFTNNSVIKEFSTNFNVDEWYNIVYTYDGNKCLLFLNGTLIGQNNSLAFLTEQGPAYIGRAFTNWGADNLFNGDIDDIRIYNRALSADEIRYLYSGQQTVTLDAPTDIQYRTTKISNSTNTKTTLIWKSVTGAKIYEVYKDGVLLGKTFSTIFYDENSGGNYKYQIASVNASGKSPLSLPCNVSVSGTNTVAGYGSLAIYITDVNKQKVENALIQFTDGSTAQTLKTGFVLLKNIPYGTTKTISRIVKSGWDFTALNGSSFSCSKSKPSMVLKYTATPTPENEPTMETFNPQYSSELVIVSDGEITLPTFTKGQDFTLDMKIASTSQYWWNGNIRLKAVRKGVEAGKTYPTYYIAQLNDVKVPMEGKMIRFTANASQLNAEAGNYELYVEAQTKEVFRQGYFILKRGKVAESTTNSDSQFKTDISVGDNLEFETNREIVTAISDAINETTGVYELFGDLIELDNRSILKGDLGKDIIIAYGWGNVALKPLAEVNSKIQFFKDLRELGQENDDILRTFKIMKYIIDKAAGGDPMAKIFKSYLDVAESMTSAIERISNGYNDATSGMVINEHPIYLKVKKDTNGWRSLLNLYGGDYFEASEFNMYIAKAEVFSNKAGSQRFTLPIEKDNTDSKRLKIRTDGLQDFQFDTGEKVFLKLTFSNKRKLIIPLNSDFVKYDGLYGAMTFVLGTTTTNATEIPEKIKIIEP